MLPPPITSPTPVPRSMTWRISPAMRASVSKSKPVPFPPASASPEILRRTLEYAGVATAGLFLAHLEADESAYLNVLANLCRSFLDEVADRFLRLAYPWLIEEAIVLVISLDFSLDHSLHDALGFSAGLRLLLGDAPLALDFSCRHAFLVYG